MNPPFEEVAAFKNTQTDATVGGINVLIRDRECGCSSVVRDLLKSLGAHERGPVVRELFCAAVRQRTKVITLSELLQELDDLSYRSDPGEVYEAAMLFEDMAEQARLGSQYLKALSVHCSESRDADSNEPSVIEQTR